MLPPSTITTVVAEQLINSRAEAAQANRDAGRTPSARFARLRGRRSGAPTSPLVPRGRTVPPLAH
jgi:hypothetical protein